MSAKPADLQPGDVIEYFNHAVRIEKRLPDNKDRFERTMIAFVATAGRKLDPTWPLTPKRERGIIWLGEQAEVLFVSWEARA